MSSARRRVEMEALYQAASMARIKEENRKASLSMWERIEEADASFEVKEILHLLAEKLGMEG